MPSTPAADRKSHAPTSLSLPGWTREVEKEKRGAEPKPDGLKGEKGDFGLRLRMNIGKVIKISIITQREGKGKGNKYGQ
jgi:hypothetical protein